METALKDNLHAKLDRHEAHLARQLRQTRAELYELQARRFENAATAAKVVSRDGDTVPLLTEGHEVECAREDADIEALDCQTDCSVNKPAAMDDSDKGEANHGSRYLEPLESP